MSAETARAINVLVGIWSAIKPTSIHWTIRKNLRSLFPLKSRTNNVVADV